MSHRVLVADDDNVTLDVLRAILDLDEFEVETAADGTEALERARTVRFDVVVLDVMMPGLNGFEVCRALKDDPATASVPVVLLTARDREEDRAEGIAAGCDAYLTKPFSPLHLIEVLSELGLDRSGT
ncbi:MAG: response regulator [Actinobacteria bacterium]|nr:response regulator [Actinomycetota bacterium]